MLEEKEKPRTPPHAFPRQIGEAHYERTEWLLRVENGVSFEDALTPVYWSLVSDRLKPWDKVELRPEDGSWYAEVLVLDASRTWARVKPIMFHRLTSGDVSQTQEHQSRVIEAALGEFEIAHRGRLKWSVIRRSDKAVMTEGLGLKEDAENWIVEYAKANPPQPAEAVVEGTLEA